MSHLISRRHFTLGAMATGGMILATRRAHGAGPQLRQFHNQPADSPLHKRLVQMWDAVKLQSGGRVNVQTFADNNQIAGGDPAALGMLVKGDLDFFTLNGGSIGNLVPAMNVQGILFAFRTPEQVFGALDGDLGDYLRDEMKAYKVSKYARRTRRFTWKHGKRWVPRPSSPI
jgi:TRAP-type C4-dicarboxylate transport system substrate-binding protein